MEDAAENALQESESFEFLGIVRYLHQHREAHSVEDPKLLDKPKVAVAAFLLYVSFWKHPRLEENL